MINSAFATLEDMTQWAPPDSCSRLQMLRLDKLHPVVSGNKWFKLKYTVGAAKEAGKTTLLTFGGGYSNHLVATAFAAQQWCMQSIGIVRGKYSGEHFTPTLQKCRQYGMQLLMHSKGEYAALKEGELNIAYPQAYIIPEGGANEPGIRGAAEIAALLPTNVTDVCIAVGTGTTLNGLYAALPVQTRLHGFYAAKDFQRTETILGNRPAMEKPEVIFHRVHDPRFGKWAADAIDFIHAFNNATGIPLDVIYTSKMMMKVHDLLRSGHFRPDSRIVCIHTGGLQGNPIGLFPH